MSVYELDRQLADVAGQLILKHPLRAYDAVQVAAALRVQFVFAQARTSTATFVSADDRLLNIAQAEGLVTDNPNRHS